MSRLRFLTAGESHGPMLTGILDGVPAGVVLDRAAIEHELFRRRQGHGELQRHPRLPMVAGRQARRHRLPPTANAPSTPPPDHQATRRQFGTARVLSAALPNTSEAALSTIARQILSQVGIEVGSDVVGIGGVDCEVVDVDDVAVARARADASPVRCLDNEAATRMVAAIDAARTAGETLGGRFVVRASGLPPGLGSHTQWDRRLSAKLSAAVASIHAVKAVAFGAGEAYASTPGKRAHDPFVVDTDGPRRTSNRAGGLEGGMSTGEELRIVATLKPFSTVPGGLPSFDVDSGVADRGLVERSDVCAVPAGAIVGEAMVCLALADALLDALGGDSMAQLLEHVADRRRRAVRPRPTMAAETP